jgi:hypothetical protein
MHVPPISVLFSIYLSKSKILEILIPAASYGALQDFTLQDGFWWTFSQQAAGKCPI